MDLDIQTVIIETEKKVLKKRGRKPKSFTNNIIDLALKTENNELSNDITEILNNIEIKEIKILKKRGRKPKNFKNGDDSIISPITTVVEFEYKKRGRKPKNIIIENNTNISDKIVFDEKNENIVLHLPINSDKINNNEFNIIENNNINIFNNNNSNNNINIFNNNNNNNNNNSELNFNPQPYDPKNHRNINNLQNNKLYSDLNYDLLKYDPTPYDPNTNNMSASLPYMIDNYDNDNNNIEIDKKNDIMLQFSECNKRNEWPCSTSINCFWCCHNFQNIPCALPIRKVNEIYYVFGNFCSPECAASYNFNNHNDKAIEKFSLLNQLYRKIYNNNDYIVNLAPPQLSLRNFGGHLSIEQFRNYTKNNNKILIINMPPLVSIIPQIEETISEINVNSKNSFIPLDSERIKKYNEKLKLQINKHISDKKNTLELCMNLKYI